MTRFACRRAPLAVPDAIDGALAAAYGEPHRAYHDARHIGEVLGWFDRVADAPGLGWAAPAEVFVAILFHDAVYAVGGPHGDSEARSAAWARDAIARTPAWAAVDAERVATLVELTARHGGLRPDDVAGDRDAAHFLDSDLAIVAAAPDRYDEYERAIAIEYAAVPAPAYRAGRRAFLERLAARPRLFLSDFFHDRLDAAARANLAHALKTANT